MDSTVAALPPLVLHPSMLIVHGVLTVLMLIVCYTDGRRFHISNRLVLVVIALYPVMVLTSPQPVPWVEGIATFGGIFLITFSMFNARVMGGGDAKLISALSLWTSLPALSAFLVYTSLYGGVLALVLIAVRWIAARRRRGVENPPPLPEIIARKGKAPYGIAIALGFLTALWMGMIPGLPVPWMVPVSPAD